MISNVRFKTVLNMSWAKLSTKNLAVSGESEGIKTNRTPSPSSARRESNATAGSSTVKGLFKKLSAGKQTSSDSEAAGNDGAWKALKRMSMSVERTSERSSATRSSDGSLSLGGFGIADLAKNALLQSQGGEMTEKGVRKMSSAFRKLGKAHMMMA